MNNFTSIRDVKNVPGLLELAKSIKKQPFGNPDIGKNKTLGLFFFNPSLRTRLSTQKAARNLGMDVMVMNLNKEGWTIEMEDGTVMNQGSQEHIKEAAAVISQYCDVIGLRTFPELKDKAEDYGEKLLGKFLQYADRPIISLESATLHPLQSLADLLTIDMHRAAVPPKVVLTWAPHPKALPQAVANSFLEWMHGAEVELVVANPAGFDLSDNFTRGCTVYHDQKEALRGADFVYAKNWSSFTDYGQIGTGFDDWQITQAKMDLTAQGKFMHCLPVRRNVVVADEVLDSPASLVIEQADNRTYAAQAVLTQILQHV